MLHKFLSNATFHSLLISIDQELTERIREKNCPCGGKLHQANYPRSPFGITTLFRSHYEERFSLCCDTCRKRITPPSVRFFGRRRFPAPLLIFVCALTLGINDYRLKQIKRHFGISVSESTWKRWRRWFRQSFEETLFWRHAKAFSLEAIGIKKLFPRQLFVLFQGSFERRLHLLLRFLSPLTSGIYRAV